MVATSDKQLSKNYDRAAWFYETSAEIYSTGQIKAAKVSQLQFLSPGQSILYLGVGAGEDAVRAAQKGLKVTCIDISQGMLDRLQRKLKKKGLSAELICGNAFEHSKFEHYDAVATNFFLNCFKHPAMLDMMKHALTLLRPGGMFFVADVSPAKGSFPARIFNLVYSKWAMAMFWAMRLVPWHENYDYAKELTAQGMKVESVQDFRIAAIGPVMFHSICAVKPSRIDADDHPHPHLEAKGQFSANSTTSNVTLDDATGVDSSLTRTAGKPHAALGSKPLPDQGAQQDANQDSKQDSKQGANQGANQGDAK